MAHDSDFQPTVGHRFHFQQPAYRGAGYGWQNFIANLKRLLAAQQ